MADSAIEATRYADIEPWKPRLLNEPEQLGIAVAAWCLAATDVLASSDPDRWLPGTAVVSIPAGFDSLNRLLAWWCDASNSAIDPTPLLEFRRVVIVLSTVEVQSPLPGVIGFPPGGYEKFVQLGPLLQAALDTARRICAKQGGRSSQGIDGLLARIEALLRASDQPPGTPGAPILETTKFVLEKYDEGLTKATQIIEWVPDIAGATREKQLANIRTIIRRYRANGTPKT